MQQILNGKKEVLLQEEVTKLAIPCYPELNVKNLMEKCKKDQEVLKYLPDINEKRPCEKAFVWHILNHFYPGFVKVAISQAQKARADAYKADENKRTVLEVKPELLERLADLQCLRRAPVAAKNSLMHDRTLKTPKIGVKRKYPFEIVLPSPQKRIVKKTVTHAGKKAPKFVVPSFRANAVITTPGLLDKEIEEGSNAGSLVKDPQ